MAHRFQPVQLTAMLCIGLAIAGPAQAQPIYGDDIFLTDTTPGIVFDDTDTNGWNWAIRGRDELFHINYEVGGNTFLLFDPQDLSTAVGYAATAVNGSDLALGRGAYASGGSSLALGRGAAVYGSLGAAIGRDAQSWGIAAMALGFGANSFADNSTTLGRGAYAGGTRSTAIGAYAYAALDDVIILGGIPGFNSATTWSNVGMGTTVPSEAVDVRRSEAAARFQLTSFTNTATEAPQYIQRRARGTNIAPTAVQANDNLGLFSFRGYNGTTMGGSRATITAQAAGNFTVSSTPTRLIFATTPVGSTTPQQVMVITPDGKVQVNGQNLNVPDYVFEDDYPLMPLEELRAFIDENGHLPGIAPAHEVNENGHDLAGSDMANLRKIEELTLYTLQQERRLHEQQRELDAMRSQYALLGDELKALKSRFEANMVRDERP